jgi:hypothetical protein
MKSVNAFLLSLFFILASVQSGQCIKPEQWSDYDIMEYLGTEDGIQVYYQVNPQGHNNMVAIEIRVYNETSTYMMIDVDTEMTCSDGSVKTHSKRAHLDVNDEQSLLYWRSDVCRSETLQGLNVTLEFP